MSENKELDKEVSIEVNTEVAIPLVVIDPKRVTTQPVDQVLQNNIKVSPSESISPTNPTNLPGDKLAEDMTDIPEEMVDAPDQEMDRPFSTDVQDLHTKISVLLNILSSMLSELDDNDEDDVEEVPACDAPKMGCDPTMSCLPGCMASKLDELEEAASSYGDTVCRLKVKYGKELASSDKPGDYLVVEDRTKTSTWHLQVKKNGKPDHGLMGGAWAALHSGYRGNKYEGPNKAEALKKLKALYKREGLETPSEK